MDSLNKSVQNMLDMPLISVIVPVHNVKEYMSSCLDSVLAQTYANMEILLVDDGSTDGSGRLCDIYAKKDARVRAIHQTYKGVSEARNAALDQAKGEYIAFVDSDDLVAPAYLQTLYHLLQKYDADVAACLFERKRMEEAESADAPAVFTKPYAAKYREEQQGLELCMTSEAWLKNWHGKYKRYETVIWNKLYRTEIFRQDDPSENGALRFPAGRYHEDTMRTHLFIEKAKRVVLTDKILYIYRKREGSITNSGITKSYVEQNLAAQRERMQYFARKKYYRSYLNLLKGYVLHRLWFAVKKSG